MWQPNVYSDGWGLGPYTKWKSKGTAGGGYICLWGHVVSYEFEVKKGDYPSLPH
jgi:hypothetical protein